MIRDLPLELADQAMEALGKLIRDHKHTVVTQNGLGTPKDRAINIIEPAPESLSVVDCTFDTDEGLPYNLNYRYVEPGLELSSKRGLKRKRRGSEG